MIILSILILNKLGNMKTLLAFLLLATMNLYKMGATYKV